MQQRNGRKNLSMCDSCWSYVHAINEESATIPYYNETEVRLTFKPFWFIIVLDDAGKEKKETTPLKSNKRIKETLIISNKNKKHDTCARWHTRRILESCNKLSWKARRKMGSRESIWREKAPTQK